MTSNDEILEVCSKNLEFTKEVLTVVKSMVDLLVVNQSLPTIDYGHEREIEIENLTVEDLQAVHDDTKPEITYKVAGKMCNKCNGFISWDLYNKDNPGPPLHVTEDGRIFQDGQCPEYNGGS